MGFVIGIDGGTESLRASIFDCAGQPLGTGISVYGTDFPGPGRAEQHPEDWWCAIGTAVKAALRAAEISPDDVVGLALDTTSCTVVALDRDDNPLRPALLWMDVRAVQEAADVLATGDPALELNGGGAGPVSAEWMIPKALWLKRNERALYDKAVAICEYQDFLVRRLTGRNVASLCNVSMRWHYRNRGGGWPTTLLAALELDDLMAKWPSEIVAPGKPIGRLTAAAAEHLGLTTRTVVAQGGADAFIGMIGLGVAKPGQIALITGSSHLQLAATDTPVSLRGLWGSYADVVYPGRHVIEGGQTSSGSMVAWLCRLLGPQVDLDTLNRESETLAPGSDGLIVLDHFQGNRTPHTDALSRGAIVGLSLAHGRAHIFRALIEAISFGTKAILDTMTAGGLTTTEMIIGGGASRSPLWMQIHADTSGLPVKVPAIAEAPSLGSAILAAVGAERFPDLDAGISAMVRTSRIVEPDPERVRLYGMLFDRYRRLYPALRDWRESRG